MARPEDVTTAPTSVASFADRLKAVDPRVFDALLAVGLTVLGVGSQFAETVRDADAFRDTDAWAVVLGLLICVPTYWRRQKPLAALIVSAAAIAVLMAAEYPTNNLPVSVLFLTYAVGAFAPRPQDLIGLALANLTLAVIYLTDSPDLGADGTVLNMAIFSGGWLAGQVMRARGIATASRLAEAEERAETQRQVAARSIAEERLRIAQELHDVVAHSMSVIAVQAGMGVHVIDHRPEDAKHALEAISQTSRTTLQEMRRLLGVLRDEDGERSHAPAPGLAELPRLVEEVRGAGVPVAFTVDGDAAGVPHGVELSVYRLVQEGLTNVIKHAGRASAEVIVRIGPDEIDVEVLDDGRGAAAAVNGSDGGHGLIGMRERVALWGGALEVGPRAGGGYRVKASLPFGSGA